LRQIRVLEELASLKTARELYRDQKNNKKKRQINIKEDKKLFLFDFNNDRLVYKTSKHCSRHQTKRRRRRKTVFWDKFIFKIAARLCPYGPPW
jgi:hypothetical protein